MTPTPDYQAARIKFALSLRNHTQVDIASQCDVKATTVGAVIHGRSRSKRIELHIASITGLTLAELWPQWYGPQAQRRRKPALSSVQVAEALRAMPMRATG